MKLHKLLVYIEANFIEGIMQIMGQEFADVGLTEADMRRYINVLTQEKIIDFKGIRYASSINPHTTGRTLVPTQSNPIPVIMFITNLELVKEKLKEYESMEKSLDKDLNKPLENKQGVHDVFFDKRNGFLYIDGKEVGEVIPATDHYIFISTLYDKSNLPVSHEEIYEAVKKNKKTEIMPQTLSNTLKSEIKRKFVPSIDKIISSSKTINRGPGYILRRNIEK